MSYLQLLLESVSIEANEVANRYVSIDSSVGRDTEFVFSYTGNAFSLDVFVTSPSGVNYTTNGPHGHKSDVTKQVTILFNETEVMRVTC